MPITAWRTAALAVAFAILTGATLFALDRFARHEFSAHLRDQSARALALAASGDTPYEWRFRTADDIIAGHPFGSSNFAFVDGSLRLRPDGDSFEVGLPLARPVDLRYFPQLHIVFDAESAGQVRVVMRERLQSPEIVSAPIAFAQGHLDVTHELGRLSWTGGNAETAVRLPEQAAMLRLRISPAEHGEISIRQATLLRPANYVRLDIGRTPRIVDPRDRPAAAALDVFRLPFAAPTQKVDIAAIAATPRDGQPPLVLLPERGRVEQQIALRDAVYAALPPAILVPEAAFDETFASARELLSDGSRPARVSTRWHFVLVFGCALALARVRPPRSARWRALVEIALTLAAPLWIVVIGDGSWHAPQLALIVLAVAYAVSLSWPRNWHWNGTRPAWLAAAAVSALALLIGLALHKANGSPPPLSLSHVARYLGWALLQQYLICAVCTERWRVVTGNAYLAAYLGALCFALLHTPNAALMLATFVGGLCWCAIYLRHRALLPLAFSHAASAILLSALLPADIVRSAEVSVRFFQ